MALVSIVRLVKSARLVRVDKHPEWDESIANRKLLDDVGVVNDVSLLPNAWD